MQYLELGTFSVKMDVIFRISTTDYTYILFNGKILLIFKKNLKARFEIFQFSDFQMAIFKDSNYISKNESHIQTQQPKLSVHPPQITILKEAPPDGGRTCSAMNGIRSFLNI